MTNIYNSGPKPIKAPTMARDYHVKQKNCIVTVAGGCCNEEHFKKGWEEEYWKKFNNRIGVCFECFEAEELLNDIKSFISKVEKEAIERERIHVHQIYKQIADPDKSKAVLIHVEAESRKDERRRILQEVLKAVERIRLDVDVIVCDCGEKYKDSDLDLSVGNLEKIIKEKMK